MINRVNITINSRTYTVVANENEEYLKSLGDYINEKVRLVLSEGTHVMGEKPIVLAALNICDEYFKLMNKKTNDESVSDLLTANKKLEGEILEMQKIEKENDSKTAELKDELNITQQILEETEEKIKELEEQIKAKESQIKKQKSEFAIREKELLDMLETNNTAKK